MVNGWTESFHSHLHFSTSILSQMTVTYQTNIQDQTYNGWTNYETWNVALWIGNDEGLYDIAQRCDDYQDFVDSIEGLISKTPDGVSFTSDMLNHHELNDMIEDL